ncbi:MAG TPA: hypothetical protein VD971_06885 [Phycisphaerales bacterium]|nr:hypothetical protein [Phycisphaerales bacterium]
MADISPIGGSSVSYSHGVSGVSGSRESASAARFFGTNASADSAEISVVANYMAKLRSLPEVREELVLHAREQLERGAYDRPEVLDQALDEMIRDVLE